MKASENNSNPEIPLANQQVKTDIESHEGEIDQSLNHEESQDEHDLFEVHQEILHYERSYMRKLETLVVRYFWPMKEKEILQPSELGTLFRNIERLYIGTIKAMDMLEKHNTEFKFTTSLARVYSKNCDFLLEYSEFIDQENYLKAMELYKSLITNNRDFKEFIKAVEDYESRVYSQRSKLSNIMGVEDVSFESLLIIPVQHGPRLVLLLERLRHALLPDSEEYKIACEAIKLVDEKVIESSSKLNLERNKQRVSVIEDIIGDSKLDLKNPERILILEGGITKIEITEKETKKEQCYCYLCDDLLLLCDTSSVLKTGFSITGDRHISLFDIPDSDILEFKNSFQVCGINLEGKLTSFLLSAESAKTKIEWTHSIKAIL